MQITHTIINKKLYYSSIVHEFCVELATEVHCFVKPKPVGDSHHSGFRRF
ncbi:hypothetical protein SynA1528_02619 [Synechococcus sp. A15-28]|nr:hypothetical protein SynA1528_02619 [Synechococcus sp. A15-28]